jgi:predicted HAD superfamily phosphohydrolase
VADRKKLQEELNRVNELYQQTDVQMTKSGGSMQQRQQLRDMLNKKKEALMAELGDDLHSLNAGKGINIKNTKQAVESGSDTLGDSFKKSKLLKMLGKKAAGVIPLAGAGYAALSGDPAMAAEELAGDIPVVGQAYEAIRPEAAGESPEEERQMLAERDAQVNYGKSQARLDKLKALMGKK